MDQSCASRCGRTSKNLAATCLTRHLPVVTNVHIRSSSRRYCSIHSKKWGCRFFESRKPERTKARRREPRAMAGHEQFLASSALSAFVVLSCCVDRKFKCGQSTGSHLLSDQQPVASENHASHHAADDSHQIPREAHQTLTIAPAILDSATADRYRS